MEIYTNYFGNYKNWPKDAVPISVCRFPPKGWDGLEYKDVAPEEWLLEGIKTGNVSSTMYIRAYGKQLDNIGFVDIYQHLLTLGGGKDVVLLCYEKDGDFCHRHLLKKYLDDGIRIVDKFNEASGKHPIV